MTAQQRKLLAVVQSLTLRRPVATSEIIRHLASARQDCEGYDPVYSTENGQDSVLSTWAEADLVQLSSGGFIEMFEGTVQCNRRNATC